MIGKDTQWHRLLLCLLSPLNYTLVHDVHVRSHLHDCRTESIADAQTLDFDTRVPADSKGRHEAKLIFVPEQVLSPCCHKSS